MVLIRPLVVDGPENRLEAGDDVGEIASVENWLVTTSLVVVVTRFCEAFVTIFATRSVTVFEVDVSATKFEIESGEKLGGLLMVVFVFVTFVTVDLTAV